MKSVFIRVLFLAIAAAIVSITSSCAIKTNDSRQDLIQSGTSYAYVIVRLEFIQQIQQLCQDSILVSSFLSEDLYKQAVAQCTFDKLASLSVNTNSLTSFKQKYCQPTSDLSALTPSQQANIIAACAALGP